MHIPESHPQQQAPYCCNKMRNRDLQWFQCIPTMKDNTATMGMKSTGTFIVLIMNIVLVDSPIMLVMFRKIYSRQQYLLRQLTQQQFQLLAHNSKIHLLLSSTK